MFNSYPPYQYLYQFAQHYASPVATYMMLWEMKDYQNKVHLNKKEIPSKFLCNYAVFQDHCRKLVKEGLVNIDESPKNLVIEMTDYEFDPDCPIPC